MSRLLDETPELFIPDDALSKPSGAVVDAAGFVVCVGCKTQLPLASADIVGNGYRCAPCGHRANIAALSSGRGDPGAHLTQRERDTMYASGSLKLVAGGALLVAGVVLLAVGMFRTGGFGIVAGVGYIAVGAMRRSESR